jgi:hypothetical protein
MNLAFKEFGKVLGGRDFAEKLRNQIDSFDGVVILDFDGVSTVSHSFADELIGKLASKYGAVNFKKKIKIVNLSDINRKVFGFVISERLGPDRVA